MTCVLDASVALSLVLDDEFTAVSEKVISMVSTEGAYVPALWDFEVLNGLRSAERRGPPSTSTRIGRMPSGSPISRGSTG